MNDLIDLVLLSLGLFYATWFFYLAIMNLKRARDNDTLTPAIKVLGFPLTIVGALCTTALNIIVGTLIFLEPPRELAFTDRLKRHWRSKRWTWRKRVSDWIFTNLLDTFDPDGDHRNG